MDAEFEHTLDMEDLCLQMGRSKLSCVESYRDDILAAVHATRYYLRSDSPPTSDVWFHLSKRANVYNTYKSLVRHSVGLQFLVKAMHEFQESYEKAQHGDLCHLLRLAYFIDREICHCAAMDV